MTKKKEQQMLKFAVSFVEPDGQFHEMFDYIPIGENCFYETKVQRYYDLVTGEKSPEESVKSKKII